MFRIIIIIYMIQTGCFLTVAVWPSACTAPKHRARSPPTGSIDYYNRVGFRLLALGSKSWRQSTCTLQGAYRLSNSSWSWCVSSPTVNLTQPRTWKRSRVVCRQVCGGLSWLLISAGEPIPLWAGLSPGRWSRAGKQEPEGSQQAVSNHGSCLRFPA